MNRHVLYAMPGSLYSGKARAYLRKQRIDFVERAPGDPRFASQVVPRIGRWIIPVLETPEGVLVQDGTDIIDHFERQGLARWPVYPDTPRHRVVALLFELFGGEGLLRPAMHYRWNFDHDNLGFLSQDFSGPLAMGGTPDARERSFASASARMRKAAVLFGVTPDTIPLIERSYEAFLQLFDAHLERAPYLLGGRPTIGDYGLFAPLYAHLARDPHPSLLMKRTAWRVWRWVERMNAPDPDAGEYGEAPEALFAGDAIPETLAALLRFVAEDYLAEVEAFVSFLDGWLAARPDLREGMPACGAPGQRMSGTTTFRWRGQSIAVGVFPYRLYLLQRVQDAFAELDAGGQTAVRALFAAVGLERILTLRPARRIERRDNLEVWGEAAAGNRRPSHATAPAHGESA